jgi:hypothetical protein
MITKESPEFNRNFSHHVDFVGHERRPVLVVENFLAKPEALIELAVSSSHFSEPENLYPGKLLAVPRSFLALLLQHLGTLICNTFEVQPKNFRIVRSNFSMVLTPLEKLVPAQTRPHIDTISHAAIASIFYLCGVEKGGTSFYRHRASGFESVDETREDEYNKFLSLEMNSVEKAPSYINGHDEQFEQIASYDSVFNRIIFYHSNSLHSGNIASSFNFDPDPRTGRLTINSFFYDVG